MKYSELDQIYGDIQRGLQALRELLFNEDKEKLDRMLTDFSVFNKRGVDAAKKLYEEGLFKDKSPEEYSAECIFDRMIELIEAECS